MRYLIVLVLIATSAISCDEDRGMTTSITMVKQENEARLLAMPGVVSVGVGLDDNGEAAIIVGLSGPSQKTESELPENIGGYRVVPRYIGPVKIQ